MGIRQYRGLSGHGHQVSRQPQITQTQERQLGKTNSGKRRLRRHTSVQFSPYADTRLLTPLVPSLDRHSRHGASLHSVAQPTNTSTHSPTPHNRTPNHSSEPKSKCTRRRIRASICSVELAVRAFAPLRVNRDSWPSRTTIAPWRCPAPHPWPGCDRARRDHRSRRA